MNRRGDVTWIDIPVLIGIGFVSMVVITRTMRMDMIV